MKASVKRLIWALGFPLLICISEFVAFYGGKVYTQQSNDWGSFLLWIIPLLIFKDDKEAQNDK